VIIVVSIAFMLWDHGVRAVIRNTGMTTFHDVHVNVTGRSYTIGDIRPGESRSVRVEPKGKSQIELTFAAGNSTSSPLVISCYFGPSHYSGQITIDIADGQVVHVENKISTSLW